MRTIQKVIQDNEVVYFVSATLIRSKIVLFVTPARLMPLVRLTDWLEASCNLRFLRNDTSELQTLSQLADLEGGCSLMLVASQEIADAEELLSGKVPSVSRLTASAGIATRR